MLSNQYPQSDTKSKKEKVVHISYSFGLMLINSASKMSCHWYWILGLINWNKYIVLYITKIFCCKALVLSFIFFIYLLKETLLTSSPFCIFLMASISVFNFLQLHLGLEPVSLQKLLFTSDSNIEVLHTCLFFFLYLPISPSTYNFSSSDIASDASFPCYFCQAWKQLSEIM